MFKKRPGGGGGSSGFSAKIAHTTLMPSLVGNKDLKLLQDFITAEKSVVIGLQKLAIDTARAAETLKFWGQGEGDDLGDVLSHSAGLVLHFVDALNKYAVHEQNIRGLLKRIRSDEEYLDRLKKDRRTVGSKADSAEKKLQRMTPESKNLQEQTDLLTRLREEMKTLDTQIMNEEARLGDFKRQTSKQFLLMKFGGLLECAEKAKVAGEFGKAIVQDIPLETTIPGQARVYYNAYDNTSKLASDASRAISEIVFEPPETSLPSNPIGFPALLEPGSPASPSDAAIAQPPSTFAGYPSHDVHGGSVDEFGKHGALAPPRFTTYQTPPLSVTKSPYAPPPGPPPPPSANSSQFATLPATHYTTTMGQAPPARPSTESQLSYISPPQQLSRDVEPSFSDSVADALAADGYLRSLDGNRVNLPSQSGIDYPENTSGAQPLLSEGPGHVPPASTEKSSHIRHPGDPEHHDSEETALAYAVEPKPPTTSRKLSESLDDAYDGATHWVRKHSEPSGTPLRSPRSSQDQHRDQPLRGPGERHVHYRDDAEARSAVMREVARDMDALAFNSVSRGPDTGQQDPANAYAPPLGPPPPLSNVLRTSSRPVSPETSTVGHSASPPEPNTLSQVPSPSRQVLPTSRTTQQASGPERLSPQDQTVSSPQPLSTNSPTPAAPLAPPPRLNPGTIFPSSGPPSPRTISASAFRRPFAKKSTLGITGGLEKDGGTVAGPPYSSIPAREAPNTEPDDNNHSTTSHGSGPANTTPLNVRSEPRLLATTGARPPATSNVSDVTTNSTNEKQNFYTPSEGRGGGDEYAFPGRDETNRRSAQLPPYSQHPESGPAIGDIPDEAEFMRELELQDHIPPLNDNGARGYEAGRYSTNLQ